jgi:integrase/recombinase XerD
MPSYDLRLPENDRTHFVPFSDKIPAMLDLYRRHTETCKNFPKGRRAVNCLCPVWVDGTDVSGKDTRRSLKTRDWQIGIARMAALEGGREMPIPKPVVTVARAYESYLVAYKRKGHGSETIRGFEIIFSFFVKRFGLRPLDSITTDDLEDHLDSRAIANSTREHELVLIGGLFLWAIKRKMLTDNPCDDVELPPNESAGALPFDQSEVKAMIEATSRVHRPIRSRAVILTLLYTGLRVGDTAKLRRAQLRADGHLEIRKTQKTRVPVCVKLHRDAIDALNSLPAQGEYFFQTTNHKAAIARVRYIVKAVGKEAGVKNAHPHRWRDTFASELLLAGADVRTVSLLLGHKSVRTTEKYYAHFIASHQRLLDDATSLLDFGSRRGTVQAINASRGAVGDA